MPALDRTRLDVETHRELERLAVRFGTRAHIAWLAEALTAARAAPDDALAALELLAALQGTPYARRSGPRAALSDVGGWLEKHLTAHPALTAERLTVELGWLRRLAVAEEKRTGGGHPAPAVRPFGRSLPTLRARRPAADAKPPNRPGDTIAEPPSPEPRPPEPPPTHYAVGALDVLAAREVWKVARKRLKTGKAPKDKRIPLAARTADGGPPLEASFALTAGLADVFGAFDARGGQVHDFYVIAWDDTVTPWLATAVSPSPPADEASAEP